MYDHIQGEVVRVQPARVVLRANGVGYELHVPMGVSSALRQGVSKCLYTILHVTDGNPTLLGFGDQRERNRLGANLHSSPKKPFHSYA